MATPASSQYTQGQGRNGHDREVAEWRAQTRIFLTPLAPPSILGLLGFAVSTFMVAADLAWGYGSKDSGVYLFPFAMAFGGIAQLSAAFFSFRARDGIGVGMHGAWGSFWIGYGILNLLVAVGAITIPTGSFPEFGYWFIALAATTFIGAVAAHGESYGLAAVLHTLWAGSVLLAIGYIIGPSSGDTNGVLTAGGWVLFASAICAWYTAGALMLEGAFGRTILPLGIVKKDKPWKLDRDANVPLHKPRDFIQLATGEPGVKHGQ